MICFILEDTHYYLIVESEDSTVHSTILTSTLLQCNIGGASEYYNVL